jgi:hypothetical protein
MEETTLFRRLPKENTLKKSKRFFWVKKNQVVEIITFLLMLDFFYEGIFKIIHLIGYETWLSDKPILKFFYGGLAYIIPVFEIGISILVAIPKYRKTALYIIILSQMIFITWILKIFPFTHLVFNPFHSYFIPPRWFYKIIFSLIVAWLALVALYPLAKMELQTYRTK